MKDENGGSGTGQDDHRIKKPTEWRDYFGWMVRYAEKLVGSNDAQSVANEALLDAYRSTRAKPSVDNEVEVRRWLSVLILWRVRAHRKRERRFKMWDLCDIDAHAEAMQAHVPGQSDVVIDRIEMMRALDSLSSEERTLLMAHYVGGFSASELAQKYEKNPSTLSTHIARATIKLVNYFRRRQMKNRWSLFVFVEPFRLRAWFQKVFQHVRFGFSKTLSVVRLAGTYTSSAVVGIFMPGDSADMAKFTDTAVVVEATSSELPQWERAIPLGFVIPSIETEALALPDKPNEIKPMESARIQPIPTTVSEPASLQPIPEHVAPLDLGAALPDPYGEADTSKKACRDAFLDAQTAWYRHNDAAACLSQLNRGLTRIAKCEETPERLKLRADCRAKPTK